MTHFTDIDEFNHDLLRFPPLMWVVQDFHLSQLGSESPKDWLLRLMESSSRDDEYEINLKGGWVGGWVCPCGDERGGELCYYN